MTDKMKARKCRDACIIFKVFFGKWRRVLYASIAENSKYSSVSGVRCLDIFAKCSYLKCKRVHTRVVELSTIIALKIVADKMDEIFENFE